MKYLFKTFTTPCKCLLARMVSCAALFLLAFGAANGLASQQVKAMRVLYAQLIGDGWPNIASQKPMYFYYYIGDKPSYFEAFPFLQDLRVVTSNYGQLIDYVPYGSYPLNAGGYTKYPYFYRQFGDINAGLIPDDWTSADVANINASYNALSPEQKAALPGTFVAGNSVNGDTSTKFFEFNLATVGTPAYNGGVYTYDQSGQVVVSFPDNTGYISGYTPLPDGSYTPVYYTIENNSVVEHTQIPVADYSSLTIDQSGNYTLSIPDYSRQLDTIINKIDVSPGKVNVTVNPEVTVNGGSDLSDIESSLVDIGYALSASSDNVPSVSTNDLSLSQDEQTDISALRGWHTDLPVLGQAVDFGLNTLIGRIPNIGTEYLWLDYTIGGTRRSVSSNNPLQGYNIRIDLTSYRDTLLAVRGWLILLEALYFIILIYKAIRETLKT